MIGLWFTSPTESSVGEVFYLFALILILRKNYYRYEKVFMFSDDLYASPA